MKSASESTETVLRFEEPRSFYSYLCLQDGTFLSVDEQGSLSISCVGNDEIVWQQTKDRKGYRQVTSGKVVEIVESDHEGFSLRDGNEIVAMDEDESGKPIRFRYQRGPASLPSEYMDHFFEHGWVCLPAILPPDVVDGLEQVSCTGKYRDQEFKYKTSPIASNKAVGQAAAEPVTLWMTRQYMRTNAIRFGHAPSLAILPKDDGVRDVQGWHSDFPYLWGISRKSPDERIPIHEAPELVLGIQRNICISPFRKEFGATAFKLGSNKLHSAPPSEWGTGSTYSQRGYRKEHGLPYNGPEADIVEAPAGSIILYDARTWHRAGVNHVDERRAAMLQAIIPMYIMPFADTTGAYKQYLENGMPDQLYEREHMEIESLMLSTIVGRGGQFVIGVDQELTKLINRYSTESSAY